MHLLSQTKTGLSAMELKRQLGVKYDTAWMLKHKLLQTMKESDDKQPISGILLDDVYWRGVASAVAASAVVAQRARHLLWRLWPLTRKDIQSRYE